MKSIDSLRILEVGDFAFFKSIRPEQVDYVYIGKKHPETSRLMTYAQFRQLRGKLVGGQYDLVIFTCFGLCPVPWRPERSVFSNLARVARCFLGRFHSFGTWIILWLLRGLDVPFMVYDRKDDPNTISVQYLPLLKRSKYYFWRESPAKEEYGFICGNDMEDISAVRRSTVFKNHRHKIEPISIGANYNEDFDRIDLQAPKTLDVFFAGRLKNYRVRETGGKMLQELAAEGFRIEMIESRKYSRAEFFQRCAESWLVWSPEGHGWECYRHYEASLAGSVPVMNYPRTHRYQPLIDGVHGFYYGIEGEDLKRVIKLALSDKEKLRTMALAGRQHALAYHTYAQLGSYMLSRMFPEKI